MRKQRSVFGTYTNSEDSDQSAYPPNRIWALCCTSIYSTVSSDPESGKRWPRSDCADAQSDLGHRYPHRPRRHIFS